ncbi:IclR family transcriptional regulator [Pseudoroseomonas ludipueritiae]|uniref:IclR family transcriptional regulator n=1 Tax=Pseudoroseomonas ludipueritiae TaxID=198093 RepID=A0ABR7RC27_9PROT|nr:IclR family transcriptional regulator [Pseudoroseomonas ludipueritiae]MBC9179127.1 IclR family transcriptional regulator [Pseudoroseomonas ludipueritiae]MCG7361418.1 IclR family transcriptional regulator [Roseomonas sp. ACRSG]
MITARDERAEGVQAVRRATQILSAIARRSPSGLGLAELSRRTGLTHPTVRRILCCLIEEGFVVQDGPSRRYHLGPLIFEFGLCTPHQGALVRQARPAIERLAAATGDTVYLTARSGTDAVCLSRIEGTHPIRVVTTGEGDRRPLGVGAVGLAILSRLEEPEINSVLRENRQEYERYGLTLPKLHDAILASRQRGYGVTNGLLTAGVAGIGLAITSASGSPIAGVSLASTPDRIFGKQLEEKLALLRAEVAALSAGFHAAA